MPITVPSFLRLAAHTHRLLAVPLCLMIALWFATGTVLSFVPFPSLGSAARIGGREPVDVAAVRIEPAQAIAASGLAVPVRLRLVRIGDESRYLVSGGDDSLVAVDARAGAVLPLLEAGAARTIAGRFAGRPVRTVQGPYDYDLWTMHDKYRSPRPWYRVSLEDAAGTDLYVSARSGEVLQSTQSRERGWNRVGATVHWLNVPALRVRAALWRWTVWTIALGGIVLALLGLVLGYTRWRAQRRARRKGFSPFRGTLRWHHLLGSFAGLFLLSWVGSGWLSLELNGWFSSAQPGAAQLARYRGMSVGEAARRLPLQTLRALPAAREYEWSAVGGQPLLQLRGATLGRDTLWLLGRDEALARMEVLPDALLANAVQAAWPDQRLMRAAATAPDDAYALRGAPFPGGMLRLELDDAARTWVHVDVHSGDIVSVMDRSRRVYRWLVDGLHTFDFPPLNRGGLWHVLLVLATSSGFVLSGTGAWLAWRRLRRGTLPRADRPGRGTSSAGNPPVHGANPRARSRIP